MINKLNVPDFLLKKKIIKILFISGALFGSLGLGAFIVGTFADLTQEHHNPYQGMFTFMLFPGVMSFGFGQLVLSMFLERKRRLKENIPEFKILELFQSILKIKPMFLIALIFIIIIITACTIIGAYRAYEFTESKEFCGKLCHLPMGPQDIRHDNSAHANVACVKCHVGPHVNHYLEAKLTGMKQVYQIFTNSFTRPIHAPMHKVLPAKMTCLSCHSPENFIGAELDNRIRYGYDVRNTQRSLQLLLQVGGGRTEEEQSSGIHWHMLGENKIFFKAIDEKKQKIAYIKVEKSNGDVTEYYQMDKGRQKYSKEKITDLEEKQMDCLDCHNRPAHQFLSPDEAMDRALALKRIDSRIPGIKKLAVHLLSKKYSGKQEGEAAIRDSIYDYYKNNFSGEVLKRQETLEGSIEGILGVYGRNVFPEMNVNGVTYPYNLGHKTFDGCFRCHDGKHQSKDKKVISGECNLCHVFFEKSRGSASLIEIDPNAATVHPFTDSAHYTKATCSTCHSSAEGPYTECKSCHKKLNQGKAMNFSCSECHSPRKTEVTQQTCQSCHPTRGSLLHEIQKHENCLDCHDNHKWTLSNHDRCIDCHDKPEREKWDQHGPNCQTCSKFKGVESLMMGIPQKTPPG